MCPEVFLGDALYEIGLKNVDKPEFKSLPRGDLRKIADKLGGLSGFEISKNDGFFMGRCGSERGGEDQRRNGAVG